MVDDTGVVGLGLREIGGAALLKQLVRTAWEGHAWHFDHVVAVKDGGGECGVVGPHSFPEGQMT